MNKRIEEIISGAMADIIVDGAVHDYTTKEKAIICATLQAVVQNMTEDEAERASNLIAIGIVASRYF